MRVSLSSYPALPPHRLCRRGGTGMEVIHVHPTYGDPQERRERLAEIQRLCLRLLGEKKA